MKRLFATVLMLLFLWMPVKAVAGQELEMIKEKECTGKLYDRAIDFFTRKMPEAFEQSLNNSHRYIDLITDIFTEKGIPLDIAYLPLIESGFAPLSVGPGDAVGLWQLVRSTARNYGLRVDSYVDERKDPVKSTNAAADYLRDLYVRFGAWDIALAAYNAGEGKITRIFKKSKERLPWVINRYLAYFMAASTVAQAPENYGFAAAKEMNEDTDYREITTHSAMSLKAVAEKYKTTVNAIKKLNPALLTDSTPPYPYPIRLPNE